MGKERQTSLFFGGMGKEKSSERDRQRERRSSKAGQHSSEAVVRSGWLDKKGGMRTNWKQRWFELEPTVLRYSESPGASEKGRIEIAHVNMARLSQRPKAPRSNTEMEVLTDDRTYWMSSDSAKNTLAWIDAINAAREGGAPALDDPLSDLTSTPAELPRSTMGRTRSDTSADGVVMGVVGSPAAARAAENAQPSAHWAATLEEGDEEQEESAGSIETEPQSHREETERKDEKEMAEATPPASRRADSSGPVPGATKTASSDPAPRSGSILKSGARAGQHPPRKRVLTLPPEPEPEPEPEPKPVLLKPSAVTGSRFPQRNAQPQPKQWHSKPAQVPPPNNRLGKSLDSRRRPRSSSAIKMEELTFSISPMGQALLRARQLREVMAADIIQTYWRGYWQRERFRRVTGLVLNAHRDAQAKAKVKPRSISPRVASPRAVAAISGNDARSGWLRAKQRLRERRSAEEFVELFKFVKQMKVGSMAASLRPSEQTRNYHYTDVRPVQFVAKGSFGRVYLAEPTTTQDEGALPDGEVEGTSWETGIDEETGLNYFYNSATGESVWEMPEEVAAAIAAKKKTDAGGPEVFAMKCMSKDQMHEEGLVEAVMEERKILEMINRVPFIVKFYGAFQSPTTLFLLGQYFAGGDFLGVIQNQRGRPMPRDSVAFYCAEVLSGLHGLHALGIVYRDLKPENILVSAQGHLALTDFGTATLSESMNDVAGTLSYMAPEVLQAASKSSCSDGPGYGRPVDMWSLGVMMYEMLVGRLPFTTPNNDARTKYRIMTTAPAMNHISLSGPSGADAGELVGMLLERDTEERADVGTAQAHPFFTLPDPDGSGRRQPIDWQRVIDLGYEPPWVPPRKNRQRSVSPAEDAAAKKERERAELRALVEKYPEDLHIFDPEARVRSISWHIDSEVTHLSHVE